MASSSYLVTSPAPSRQRHPGMVCCSLPSLVFTLLLPLSALAAYTIETALVDRWIARGCAALLVGAVLVAIVSTRNLACARQRDKAYLIMLLHFLFLTSIGIANASIGLCYFPVPEGSAPSPMLLIVSTALNLAVFSIVVPYALLLIRMRNFFHPAPIICAGVLVCIIGITGTAHMIAVSEDHIRSGLYSSECLLALAVLAVCCGLRDGRKALSQPVVLILLVSAFVLSALGTGASLAIDALYPRAADAHPDEVIMVVRTKMAFMLGLAASTPALLVASYVTFEKSALKAQPCTRWEAHAFAASNMFIGLLILCLPVAAFYFGYTAVTGAFPVVVDDGSMLLGSGGANNGTIDWLDDGTDALNGTTIMDGLDDPDDAVDFTAPKWMDRNASAPLAHIASAVGMAVTLAALQAALAYDMRYAKKLSRKEMDKWWKWLLAVLAVVVIIGEICFLVTLHLFPAFFTPLRLGFFCLGLHSVHCVVVAIINKLRSELLPIALPVGLVLFAVASSLLLYGELTQCFPGQPPAPPTIWLAVSLAAATALQLVAIPAVKRYRRDVLKRKANRRELSEAFRADAKARLLSKRFEKARNAELRAVKEEEQRDRKAAKAAAAAGCVSNIEDVIEMAEVELE